MMKQVSLMSLFSESGVVVSPQASETLSAYADAILEWNRKINLVSRRLSREDLFNHVLHSLSVSLFFSFSDELSCIDIGTGGGLPGIPLAICFPKCHFTLVDATNKKIVACQSIVKALGLENVTCLSSRIEAVRGKFDVGLCRHVTIAKEVVSLAKPLIKKGGHLILFKGTKHAEAEMGSVSVERYVIHELTFGEAFAGKCILDLTL